MSAETSGWSRRAAMAVSCAGIAAVAMHGAVSAQDAGEGNSMIVDGVLAYLGVLPAEIVRGHPRYHPEGAMHGGAPGGRNQYHLVLALFDAVSGSRIETAQVSVTVMGLGHTGGTQLDVEPMTIADTVTWGTFVRLTGRELYDLSFAVLLPGRTEAIVFPFRYALSAD